MNAVRRTRSLSLSPPAGLFSLAGLIRWVVDVIVGPPAPVPVPVRASRDRRPRR